MAQGGVRTPLPTGPEDQKVVPGQGSPGKRGKWPGLSRGKSRHAPYVHQGASGEHHKAAACQGLLLTMPSGPEHGQSGHTLG